MLAFESQGQGFSFQATAASYGSCCIRLALHLPNKLYWMQAISQFVLGATWDGLGNPLYETVKRAESCPELAAVA